LLERGSNGGPDLHLGRLGLELGTSALGHKRMSLVQVRFGEVSGHWSVRCLQTKLQTNHPT